MLLAQKAMETKMYFCAADMITVEYYNRLSARIVYRNAGE